MDPRSRLRIPINLNQFVWFEYDMSRIVNAWLDYVNRTLNVNFNYICDINIAIGDKKKLSFFLIYPFSMEIMIDSDISKISDNC